MSDIIWMPMEEAMQILIDSDITSNSILNRERRDNGFSDKYPNIPALPYSTYKYKNFWKDVRLKSGKLNHRWDLDWIPLDDAISFCIKHNLTGDHKLAAFKNDSAELIKIPTRVVLVYNCPDFFKRVRKSLGIISRYDKEWMTKKEAISYCVANKIHSGSIICKLSKENKIDKLRMPCDPKRVYSDPKFWVKVRKSLGMVAANDKVWMDPKDAIAIFSEAGVTSKQKALENKHLFKTYLNLPMRPASVYKDKRFWKKVRNDVSELDYNFIVPENFSERYPNMPGSPPQVYGDEDFWRKVRIAFKKEHNL